MAKITFENKVATRISSLPAKNQIRDEDINEIKSSVNALYENAIYTVDLLDAQTFTFASPESIKINSFEIINGNTSQDIDIEVEAYPYTLGDSITKGWLITVTSVTACVINLSIELVP